jgi:hypothetical protein
MDIDKARAGAEEIMLLCKVVQTLRNLSCPVILL